MSSLIGSIASQLGDTNGLLEKAIEEATLEELDFELACESIHHTNGRWDHAPEEPAAWLVINPCGHQIQMCNSFVVATITEGVAVFCRCGTRHAVIETTFIPLAQTGGES